jgi:ribosome biogenesis GTPase A
VSINWYPGHMVAAQSKAIKAMADIDVVIEVLDGRCPGASSNPMIEKIRMTRQRPCLKVLSKADLADPAATNAWLNYFNAQKNTKAIALSSKKPGDANRVIPAAQLLAPHRTSFLKPLRVMMMGVPNVGKSTLVNALLKKRSAAVGDEPAITKVIRRYILSDTLWLFDTPGLMWPKIEDLNDGPMLAASHSIGTNAYFEEEVATYLGTLLIANYPALLTARYGCEVTGLDGTDLIAAIAAKRGLRIKGGAADLEKAAIGLLLDYRSGALGRVSLETPASRAARPIVAVEPKHDDPVDDTRE